MVVSRYVVALGLFCALFSVLAAGQTDDDRFASNNDAATPAQVTFGELMNANIPRLTSTQRFTANSQAFFGVGGQCPGTCPPFENSFNPINTPAAQLTDWGFDTSQVTPLVTHIVITAQLFLDDYTRSTALNLGRDPGASAEAAAIVGFASSRIIATQLQTEISNVCGTCDPSVLATLYSPAAASAIQLGSDGIIFIGDLTSTIGRKGVVGHTYTFNVSMSLNAVDVISNSRISSAQDLASILATAFGRAPLVQASFRAAAKAVLQSGYVDMSGNRKRSTARITRVIAQASTFSAGVANKIYGIVQKSAGSSSAMAVRAAPRSRSASASAALRKQQQKGKKGKAEEEEERRVLGEGNAAFAKAPLEVKLVPEGIDGTIALPHAGRKLRPGVKALRERKLDDPMAA